MIKIFKRSINKVGSVAIVWGFLLSLTSCSSLPDYLKFGDKNLTNNVAGLQSESGIMDNSQSQQYNSNKVSQLSKELQSAVTEWQSLKPSINRLVEMENDLSYLLVQLGDVKSTPMLEISNDEITDTFVVAEKFEAEASAEVELAKAAPIIDLKPSNSLASIRPTIMPSAVDSSTIAMKQDKFSSANQISSVTQAPITYKGNVDKVAINKFANGEQGNQIIKQGVEADKFTTSAEPSSFSEKNIVISGSANCQRAESNTIVSDGIAIHIASFKSHKLAEDSLSKFESQYRDIACNKSPVIKQVIVKNVTYHSARLGPYLNRKEAEAACRAVRTVQSYCAITDFEGVVL